MTREKIMEKRAAEAENLQKLLSKNPNGFWVI
jgi:hypothetical protein